MTTKKPDVDFEATSFAIVLTTAGSDEEADRIAVTLVDRQLAACVNVVPQIVSHYRWQGVLRKDVERLLVVKTSVDRFAAVRDTIVELHSYNLPEVVMLDIADGDPHYLAWLGASLGESEEVTAWRTLARGPSGGPPRPRRRPKSGPARP